MARACFHGSEKLLGRMKLRFSLPPIFRRDFTHWLSVISCHTEKNDVWNSPMVSVRNTKKPRGQCFLELKPRSCTFIVSFWKSQNYIFVCAITLCQSPWDDILMTFRENKSFQCDLTCGSRGQLNNICRNSPPKWCSFHCFVPRVYILQNICFFLVII